jgi:hypothetical protein
LCPFGRFFQLLNGEVACEDFIIIVVIASFDSQLFTRGGFITRVLLPVNHRS